MKDTVTVGKVANSAKTSIMEEFLEFVEPYGRRADCTGPTFYFLPKFSTIQMPKAEVGNYETRMLSRSQSETGKMDVQMLHLIIG